MTPDQIDYELTSSMEHMRGIYNPPEGLTFSLSQRVRQRCPLQPR